MKALLLASTPTAVGPFDATAAFSAYSLPFLSWTNFEIRAPIPFEVNVHSSCYMMAESEEE